MTRNLGRSEQKFTLKAIAHRHAIWASFEALLLLQHGPSGRSMDVTAALTRPLMHGTGRDVSCRRGPVPQLIRRFSPIPRENHTDCMACAQRIGLPGVSVLEPPLVVLYWVTEMDK
jgi:hypothetical protein